MESVPFWLIHYGYAALFVLLMVGIVGLPLPDETLLAFAGHLISKGKLAFVPTIGTAFLGSLCGITVSYALGRWAGAYFMEKLHPILRFDVGQLEKVRNWFAHRGALLLFFGYFVPGVRHFTALIAGSSKLPVPVFALFAYTGALFWSVTFIALGYSLQEGWKYLSVTMHEISVVTVLVFVLIALIALLLGRWQRADAVKRAVSG